MSNDWLRLWHDMPTDPKWRTIARASGQSIGNVMAVYVHLLVCASNATERGRTQSFVCEDVASALDMNAEDVEYIIEKMQGRVLDGDRLRGWEKRQPVREDGAAERAKAWREAQKEAKRTQASAERTQPNAEERKRSLDTDTDTDTEKKDQKPKATPPAAPDGGDDNGQRYSFKPPEWVPDAAWQAFVEMRRKIRAPLTNHAAKLAVGELDGLRLVGNDPVEVLNQSVMNSWRGLFAVKSKVVQMPLTAPPEPIKASHQPLRHTPRG
jgi:hypothetical protein